MTYKYYTILGLDSGRSSNNPVWVNFCTYVREKYHIHSLPIYDELCAELKAYSATNDVDTLYIEFEKEEDATAFILQFS